MSIDIDKLKVYTPILSDDDKGVFKVSLVEEPCFETDFIFYGEGKNYHVTNEERREVMGAIIIANKPVLRNDPPLGYHYMLFTPEIIRELRDKYFRDGHTSDTNIHHETDVEGVYLIESVIKDSRYNIPAFNSMPDGTWIGTFKVENDDVWDAIKDGDMKGFSMEIDHSYTRLENIDNINDFKLTTNFMAEKKAYKELERRKVLREIEYKYSIQSSYDSVMTDKGELTVEGEFRDGARGAVLFDPNARPAPDGIYKELDGSGDVIKEIAVEGHEIVSYRNPGDNNDEYDVTPDVAEDIAEESTEDVLEDISVIIKEEIEDVIDRVNNSEEYSKKRLDAIDAKLDALYKAIKIPIQQREDSRKSYTRQPESIDANDRFMAQFVKSKNKK